MLITISKVADYVGNEVKMGAWLVNKRSSGKIIFLQLRDGTRFIQAVVGKNDVSPEVWELADTLTQEASLYVTGTIREDTRSDSGYELSVTDLELIQQTAEYPISNKEHGTDFLLDHRHLWIRTNRQRAILRIRAEVLKAFRTYLDNDGFTAVDAPILTASACEGTTNLFKTSYFDDDAYLSQSGQLYVEAAAMALNRVYCLGPTFRAEKSKTKRHLIEFWMLEPEMAFVDHEESLKIQEELISYVISQVLTNCAYELKVLERDVSKLADIKPPFPRITYDEAITKLNEAGFSDIAWGDDFGAPHERAIAEFYNHPVFITHYPTDIKSFYMKPMPDRPEVVLCADLIAPEGYGEIVGGSERISDLELLQARFAEHKLPLDTLKWYMELRQYGSVPHSGFGLGIERFVAWMAGIEHVREANPFPRMLNRFYP